MQIGQKIIPNKVFKPTSYLKVLNSINGVITTTERKMLLLFNRFCFNDGDIYPKRATIAFNLGIKPRQVSRLTKSLTKKGFISVTEPTLFDRHSYGKGNIYHLLFHKAYSCFIDRSLLNVSDEPLKSTEIEPKMTHEKSHKMTPEKNASTLYTIKDLKTKKEKAVHNEEKNREGEHGSEQKKKRWVQGKKQQKNNKLSWQECFIANNKDKNQQCVLDAIESTVEYKRKNGMAVEYPRAYAQKIVNIQSGNYNAAEFDEQQKPIIEELEAANNHLYAQFDKAVGISKIGSVKSDTIMHRRKKMSEKECNSYRNEQRNKLFELFG